MSKKWKWCRRILAALVFIVIVCEALGATGACKTGILLQFAPALLTSVSLALPVAIVVFLIVFALTFVFGRVYCSVLCPLGILQDIFLVLRMSRKKKPGPFKHYDTRIVKIVVFCIVVPLFCFGITLPMVLLLPSSNFFALLTNVFVQGVFRLTQILGMNVEIKSPDPQCGAYLTSLITLVILFAMTIWKGRLYCNTLCPVGAVLSIPAKFARYGIKIDADNCKGCGLCEKSCKAGCIDAKSKTVLTDNCVVCGNCLDKCPRGFISFGKIEKKSPKPAPQTAVAAPEGENAPAKAEEPKKSCNLGRRYFIAEAAGIIVGAGAGAVISKLTSTSLEEEVEDDEDNPLPSMPPGAITRKRFQSHCVGCGLCIAKCTGGVLKASVKQYGLAGFMQPYLDYKSGFCSFTCKECSDICPTGALVPMTLEEKQTTRVGLAQFTGSRCVACKLDQDCGACGEHCPVGAIVMTPFRNTKIPRINEDLCIGCGACQHICPGLPETGIPAIQVYGVKEQIKVEKPVQEEAKKLQAEDDFPF